MKTLLFLFLLFPGKAALSQIGDTAHIHPIAIHSDILQEDRYFNIYIPAGLNPSAQNQCPVIYVLDGAAHLNAIIADLKQLSKETGDPGFNRQIVVGIGNIWERDRDYTPTHIVSSPFVDTAAARVSGGGDKFIGFLEKELIPYIDSRYHVSRERVLFGHSLGGLMAIDIMLHHTALFSKYAAIDPSMWWDDKKLLKQSQQVLAKNTFKNVSLFMAIANTMDKNMNDVSIIKDDTSRRTLLIRPSLDLVDFINANNKSKLKFYWKYYRDFNHMTVVPSAAYDALKFLLRSP